jgi:hypothetical protein
MIYVYTAYTETHTNIYIYIYIILTLGLYGLFSSRTPMEHRAHPLGWAHPNLETTALDHRVGVGSHE